MYSGLRAGGLAALGGGVESFAAGVGEGVGLASIGAAIAGAAGLASLGFGGVAGLGIAGSRARLGLVGARMSWTTARRPAAAAGKVTPPHRWLRFSQDIDVPDSSMLCR